MENTGLDTRVDSIGRSRPATYAKREPVADPPPFDPDTGEVLDEAPTFSQHEPAKPRRRPIAEILREAGAELARAVERLERVAEDDRYPANADIVTPYIRNAINQLEALTNNKE